MLPTPEGTIRFNTMAFVATILRGNGWTGCCDIYFHTAEGKPDYATVLGPEGVQQLMSMLRSAQLGLPTAPPIRSAQRDKKVFASITYGPETLTYFGQPYKADVIKAMGVLMIRVNIVDQELIDLTVALTETSAPQIRAQYYATTNMKARLDGIRALLPVSNFRPSVITAIEATLKRIKKAADRRNDLVHARWTFRRGKHRAVLYRPTGKVKETEITVSARQILDIAEAYDSAILLLKANIFGVGLERQRS